MKPTNDDLAEYMKLEEMVKTASARMEEIKKAAKEHGSFATREYVAAVTEASRTQLAGLETVAQVYGREDLEKHGLIKTISYQMVKITRRAVA
jgi:hypothetical protein